VTSDEKKSWAVELLCEKSKELNRMPKKDDFDEITRSQIKAFLGPWPRALEAAGLKEAKKVMVKSQKRKKAAKKARKKIQMTKHNKERKKNSIKGNISDDNGSDIVL